MSNDASPLTVEIARELYDRFMMGGWVPQEAYPEIEEWLRSVRIAALEEAAKVADQFCGEGNNPGLAIRRLIEDSGKGGE